MKTNRPKPKPKTASPRKPGKREENREQTKQAILKAALELFSKRGFYRTKTKEISRKAGIAEGTLFNYFRTKEDLALYFFQRQIADLIDGYDCDQRLKDAPLPEKLFSIIHRHLDLLEPYQDFIGAVYLRALRPVSRLNPISLDSQELSLNYLRFIRGILADAEQKEEIPPVGDIGAYAFWLFHLAIVTYWLQDQSRGKEDTLALLDRSLKVATSILKSGGWEW
jgi:AcrR family transcriptional regulator